MSNETATFGYWLSKVNVYVGRLSGESVDSLTHYPYLAWYEAGESPAVVAKFVVHCRYGD